MLLDIGLFLRLFDSLPSYVPGEGAAKLNAGACESWCRLTSHRFNTMLNAIVLNVIALGGDVALGVMSVVINCGKTGVCSETYLFADEGKAANAAVWFPFLGGRQAI